MRSTTLNKENYKKERKIFIYIVEYVYYYKQSYNFITILESFYPLSKIFNISLLTVHVRHERDNPTG
jgi:hypothetical protein